MRTFCSWKGSASLTAGKGRYHPIVDILKSNFGMEDGDTDAEVTDKSHKRSYHIGDR